MIKKLFLATVLAAFCQMASAFNIQEVAVYSEAMSKDVKASVITPESYDGNKTYPVVYLLHGFSGNHEKWATEGHVGKLVDLYDVIVVIPDGGYSSWYFDSPVMPEYKYETFVSKELIAYVDSNFKTIADRKARAIAGNSMGGHGAFYLAIRHQDIFGNVGSMSGCVDIRPFPTKWHISQRLGTIEEYPENWENNTVINMTHLIKPDSLNIIFDCGSGDFLYEVNCNLHKKLLEENIPHEFHSRPGKHTWSYWFNTIKYQLLFFNDHFVRE